MAVEAAFDFREDGAATVLALRGDWTVDTIAKLEQDLAAVALAGRPSAGAVVDVAQLGRIDVAGAYLVERTMRAALAEARMDVRGEHPTARRLFEAARSKPKRPHRSSDSNTKKRQTCCTK